MAARKQTGDRVSRIAARVMKRWGQNQREAKFWRDRKSDMARLTWSEALALAGSAMGQDETKGKRKRARK